MFQGERTYLLHLPVVGMLAPRPKFPSALSLTKNLSVNNVDVQLYLSERND